MLATKVREVLLGAALLGMGVVALLWRNAVQVELDAEEIEFLLRQFDAGLALEAGDLLTDRRHAILRLARVELLQLELVVFVQLLGHASAFCASTHAVASASVSKV
jgi:hypothetical protein